MTRAVGPDLGRRPFGDLLAVVEDRDPVADAHDHAHVVLDEQDRQAQLVPDPAEEGHHRGRLGRVHARRRLVEQQQLGPGRERSGDLEAALVAVGQVAGQLVLAAGRPT